MAALTRGCPGVEFVAVAVDTEPDVKKAIDLNEQVDGYLVYVMTLVWQQGPAIIQIAQLGKPTLDSEYGCRTKLIGEVAGDIGRLFDQWDKFGWHRVTVYGDVKEPLMEFAKALDLTVIEEA